MTPQRRIVGLCGLSGAGKTTLLRSIANFTDICCLSASTIIQESRYATLSQDARADLRLQDIDDNQVRFVNGFNERKHGTDKHLFFDCHVIIDSPAGIKPISHEVFYEIGLTDLLFLRIDPMALLERRIRDASRSRPERTVDELSQQQDIALRAAEDIADRLGIALLILKDTPDAEFSSFIATFSRRTKGGAE